MSDEKEKPLSLLSAETSGGDTAGGGFTFQDGVILAKVPYWLARDGFTMMIREAMLDAEASFFVPGLSLRREGIEAKNHLLTPVEFWQEIDTFRRIDAASPDTYQWFTLVSTGLSAVLRPLANGLRRLRGAHGFYAPGSGVSDHSYTACLERIRTLGKSDDVAQFVFEKVLLEPDWSLVQDHCEGIFRQKISTHLPQLQDVPHSAITRMYDGLQTLISARRGQTVARHEIERVIKDSLPTGFTYLLQPVRLFTTKADEEAPTEAVRLEWSHFFGGDDRTYPEPSEWDIGVTGNLQQIREWLATAHRPRRLRLSGSRRLSASLAIGAEFSAVAGFAIEMEYRGGAWRTDDHVTPDTPPYDLEPEFTPGSGEQLLLAVGIPRPVLDDVYAYAQVVGLEGRPLLNLHSTSPIISPEQANAVVSTIKRHVTDALKQSGARSIDLFFAGPAPLALFLGHRLNATTPIQCYEWVSAGKYVPTCRLYAASK